MSEDSSNSSSNVGTTAANPNNKSSNSNSNSGFLDGLRRANWCGRIPVKLILAQTSLSSGTAPHPQHILVSRHTFLHLGLEAGVRKLHEHSIPTLSFFGTSTKVVVQEDDEDNPIVTKSEKKTATATDEALNKESTAEDATGNSTVSRKDDATSESSGSRNGTDKKGEESEGENGGEESTIPEPREQIPYPICWFEDVATQQPLRWQYFVGVLFDSLHPAGNSSSASSRFSPPPTITLIPWEIRVHFGSYPSHKLLELCDPDWGHPGGVLETIRQTFRNSLKQGLVIRYGTSKEALNLSKHSHDAIWDAIAQGNYDTIAPIIFRDDELETGSEKPPAATATASGTETKDAGDEISNAKGSENDNEKDAHSSDNDTDEGKKEESPLKASNETTSSGEEHGATKDDKEGDHQHQSNKKTNKNKNNNLVMIPVRLSLGPTEPMIQKRFDGGNSASGATLGSLLHLWAPSHFGFTDDADAIETMGGNDEFQNKHQTNIEVESKDESVLQDFEVLTNIQPLDRCTTWRVAGLTPPLSTKLLDLWVALRHPDNFLYISVSVNASSS